MVAPESSWGKTEIKYDMMIPPKNLYKKSPSDKSKGRMTRGSTFSSFSFLQKKTSFSHQVTLTKENKKSPLVARTKGRI